MFRLDDKLLTKLNRLGKLERNVIILRQRIYISRWTLFSYPYEG